MTDEILSEIRRTRAAYSDRFQGNIAAMLADLEASPDAAGHTGDDACCAGFPPLRISQLSQKRK